MITLLYVLCALAALCGLMALILAITALIGFSKREKEQEAATNSWEGRVK
jgi:hypothetical protein